MTLVLASTKSLREGDGGREEGMGRGKREGPY